VNFQFIRSGVTFSLRGIDVVLIIEKENLRRVQTILIIILWFLWVISMFEIWQASVKSSFDAIFIVTLTALAVGIALFVLARKWEGVVVSQSEKIQYLDNPNSVDDRVEVHYAQIRLASGRLKKVRLGSNKEMLDRLDIMAGDRLVKKRWALFCIVEKQ
jgi:hypothetical protein